MAYKKNINDHDDNTPNIEPLHICVGLVGIEKSGDLQYNEYKWSAGMNVNYIRFNITI